VTSSILDDKELREYFMRMEDAPLSENATSAASFEKARITNVSIRTRSSGRETAATGEEQAQHRLA
jgi:hypothetical protein